MYIKELSVSGFTSYRNKTGLSDLSPGLNVVVGRNGSGKSNFFAAIRFILGENSIPSSNTESRRAWLHSGSGPNTIEAEVEVVFDNSDKRFPSSGPEVRITRTLSRTRDDYTFDGKASKRSELLTHLEAAGFAHSNPFYIVPQGRVTALTNATNEERLELLLTVSGADVYDSKRADSVAMLGESRAKLGQTTSRLDHIGSRLGELELEMEDLHGYLDVQKQRRAIEYVLLEQEATKIQQLLAEVVENQQSVTERRNAALEELSHIEEAVNEHELSLTSVDEHHDMVEAELNEKERALLVLKKEKASVQLELDAAGDSVMDDAQGGRSDIEAQIAEKETSVAVAAEQAAAITDQLSEHESRQRLLASTLESVRSQIHALQVKKGRFARFQNAQERDEWLTGEIDQLKGDLDGHKTLLESANQAMEIAKAQREQKLAEISELKEQLEQLISNLRGAVKLEESRRIELDKLESERGLLQLRQKKAGIKRATEEKELELLVRNLAEVLSYDKFKGLEATNAIAKDLGIQDKVYGTVAELVTVGGQFVQVAEVAAAGSLFHIVVEDQQTASRIMEKLGETTNAFSVIFVPLAQISGSLPRYPEGNDNAVPLVKYVKVAEKFQSVVNMVFGNILVCSDMDVARRYANEFRLRCITLKGDSVDGRGVLTGGYSSAGRTGTRTSALASASRLRDLRAQAEASKTDAEVTTQRLDALHQEVTRQHNLINACSIESEKARSALAAKKAVIAAREQEARALQELEQSHLDESASRQLLLDDDSRKIETLQADVGKDFNQSITAEEAETLARLSETAGDTEPKLETLRQSIAGFTTELSTLESTISAGRSAIRTLKSSLAQVSEDDGQEHLRRELRRKDAALSTRAASLESAVDSLKSRLADARNSQHTTRSELEAQIKARDRVAVAIMKHDKQGEKLSMKKLSLETLKQDNDNQMRNIGSVSSDAFNSTYQDKTSEQLADALNELNTQLQGFTNVNKKAIEQHATYMEQLQDLRTRETELTANIGSIDTLIEKLDAQKDSAINQTFKSVAKAFEMTFRRLVPTGAGKLIMSATSDDVADGASRYTGVSFEVSFDGNDRLRVQQLSGGQKSICALALIFAIQVTDPAPFYIFDEIDANLDPHYRGSVASMVHDLSRMSNAQFICTTFRPELVSTADKLFGVSFSRGVSTIQEIDQEVALSFVDAPSDASQSASSPSSP